MATYSQLANTSFTDVIIPFTTFNGLNERCTTLSQVITGYTLPNAQFTFTPDVSALKGTYIGASLDKLIWDFGDGTTDVGFSVTKHYAYPGMYEVTMIITDQNGVTHRNRASQTIKISNYVSDALMWWTPTIANPAGGMPERCLCGQPSNDLTLYRYNSWQSWPVVSGDGGYNINLYSQGSRSRPLTTSQYETGPDVHFTANWRFIKGQDQTKPVERIQTDHNEHIHVRVLEDGSIEHTAPGVTGSVFAGTSGHVVVNYIDDNANRLTSTRPDPPKGGNLANVVRESVVTDDYDKSEGRDIILYASFDTSKFPVTHYDDAMAEYDLLKQNYFQIYETQKVGLPIQVKFETPKVLSITSNGILDFPITPNKYIDSPISVSVRTTGMPRERTCVEEIYPELRVNSQESTLPTNDIVPLSSAWTAPNVAFSAYDVTTDVITAQGYVNLYLSGGDSVFFNPGSAISTDMDFKRWDVGAIIPMEQSSSYVRLLITELDGTERPYPNGRIVTLLLTQLSESDRELIIGSNMREFVYGTGAPRYWKTTSGEEYLAYISPDSRYSLDESVAMDIVDAPLATKTHGSYNCMVNLNTNMNVNDFSKKYRLFASTLIDPPLYFTYDVLYYYLANPSNDVIHQIKPVYYRTYSYGDEGFTQTYTSPIVTTTPGNSGLYGFAVDPTGNMICVDGDTDRILRHYRNNTVRDEIQIHTLLPEVSANHYPGNPDEYGYSPSSVSMDSCLNYWVTLYDAVSTIKLHALTNEVLAVAVPPEENLLANFRTTKPVKKWSEDSQYQLNRVTGVQGEYGENMLQPTSVETCVNDDIIVTYTNPVCSFVARYDKNGKFLHKWAPFGEDRYFTGEVCVDASDHTWVVTEGTGLNRDGSVDMSVPRGVIYSLDEKLNYRLHIDSVSGAEYQDMKAPVPHTWEQVDTIVTMNQYWDEKKQEFAFIDLLIDGYDPSAINPRLVLYEGNTYTFKNIFYNRGQHGLVFQEIAEVDLGVVPLTASSDNFAYTGALWTHNTSGINTDQTSDVPSEETIAMLIDDTFPEGLLLIDYNNPENRLVLQIVKKDEIVTREADTFDIINNPTYVIPDNNNNIWFSWGYRFCSRYNVYTERVDTTVAVGSAYYDPRYDPLSAQMHDRRDNTDRRSSIEGLNSDTANNLLIINNADKRLYALNSDTPTVSAYVTIDNYQAPATSFSWVKSISSDEEAEREDFLAPGYLTDEQIKVFLSNTDQSLTESARLDAYNEYVKTVAGDNGDVRFRKSHALGGLSAVGFEQEIRAGGDWTGWKWINKYDERLIPTDNTSGFALLTGCSDEFTLLPQVGTHDIMKTGEDINFAEIIRSYMQQPSMKDREKLYDEFLNGVFGGSTSDATSMGKRIYERIENFVDNHADVDICTIQALYSLADMVNYRLEKLDAVIPAELTRILDTLSVKFTKLRGTLTNYQDDFEKFGNFEQDSVGVNLGSELMFILDYDPTRSYATGDYVHYNGEYYQTKKIARPGTQPSKQSDVWRHWPDGEVRSRDIDAMGRAYPNLDDEAVMEKYLKQRVTIKLIQNLQLDITQSYVLREVFSNKMTIVRPVAISFPESLKIEIESTNIGFIIKDDNNRLESEIISDTQYSVPFVNVEDDLITVIDTPESPNPTLNLFRDRTYTFSVTSPGDPIYITTELGVSSSAVLGYVGNQGIEFGLMTLKTSDDPLYDPLPDRLYYMSLNSPEKSGAININDVKNLEGYSTTLNGISAYNLNISVSSHRLLDGLGWGLEFPEGNNAWQYYQIFEYRPEANVDQVYINNIIDWSSDQTTNTRAYKIKRQFEATPAVTMSVDAFDTWVREYGDMDIIIEKNLREGLGLNDGINSLSNYTTGI